jgi:hypothetical protein
LAVFFAILSGKHDVRPSALSGSILCSLALYVDNVADMLPRHENVAHFSLAKLNCIGFAWELKRKVRVEMLDINNNTNEISLLALFGTYLKCKHDNCKSGIDLHLP